MRTLVYHIERAFISIVLSVFAIAATRGSRPENRPVHEVALA